MTDEKVCPNCFKPSPGGLYINVYDVSHCGCFWEGEANGKRFHISTEPPPPGLNRRLGERKDMSKIYEERFKDKDYRHGYADEFLNVSIATQIKVLREQRGWTQEELAKKANMKQSRISVMENVNYSSWNINTLRKLAKAFDLTLRISFDTFKDQLNEVEQFGRESLERDSFESE